VHIILIEEEIEKICDLLTPEPSSFSKEFNILKEN